MDVDDGRTTSLVGIPNLPPTGMFTVPTHMTSTTIVPQKRKQKQVTEDSSTTEAIDCICGFAYEDGGLSIACDDCGRWCHTTCFNISEGAVPEEWRCWECLPRTVDKERAVFLQQQRQRQNYEMMHRLNPSVEKKPRRASAPAIEGSGGRRKRSILTQQHNHHLQSTRIDEEPIDVCEPSNASYVHISNDVVSGREARQRLERAARGWRGVTVLDIPEVELLPSKTVLQPLPPSFISQSPHPTCTNPHVRPPSFSLHTAQPVPRSTMITPYPSTILSSSTYLSDPLNAYAYLGMPKPFVHLIGPPLDLALDSRITGSEARFARSGCRPNAVLRPMICNRTRDRKNNPSRDEESGISFGVFALRDIKANEEVVLGWEWDDGHAVHHLPTLIESPGIYSPHHLDHLRNQMSCMLHTLSSTFTTCACGSNSKSCVLRLMEAFVDYQDYQLSPKPPDSHVDLGPLVGRGRGFRTREKVPFSGGLTGVEMVTPEPMSRATSSSSTDSEPHGHPLDGDAISQQAAPSTPKPSSTALLSRKRRHGGTFRSGKGSSSDSDADHSATPRQRQKRRTDSKLFNPELPQTVNQRAMPAKMRKQWIHQTIQEATPGPIQTDEASGTEEEHMDVDHDSAKMPPPPNPPRRKSKKAKKTSISTSPTSISSPSTHFAKLSLLSPTVEIPKTSLDFASSFNDCPRSPTPSISPSTTMAGPPIKLHTKPISPLLAFTNLPTQPTITKPPPVPDLSAVQKPRAGPADENLAHPPSPNLLSSVPNIRRERDEEPVRIVIQELAAPLLVNTDSTYQSTTGTSPMQTPQITPSEDIPLTSDLRPDAYSSPREPAPQQSSDHHELVNAPELPPYPPTTESTLQATSEDTGAAEPPAEAEQEPERQPTPPHPVREPSPTPQKVKTSFKDFLMRKKKEQVESPVDSSPTVSMPGPIPTVPLVAAPGSDSIADPSEEENGPVNQQSTVSPVQPSLPPVTELLDMVSHALPPVREPEPVTLETAQPPNSDPDPPPGYWILDAKVFRPGVVVNLVESIWDQIRGGPIVLRGVVDSIGKLPHRGYPGFVDLRLSDGTLDTYPLYGGRTTPVKPSEEGEVVIILSGQHKGKVGKVVRLGKWIVSIDLDGPESKVVDVNPAYLCLFFREGRAPLPNPTPPAPPPLPEKENSPSPPPAPQSEDGEIPQDLSPKVQPQQPGSTSPLQATTPLRASSLNPPTHPRSFQTTWKNNSSTIPSRSNSLSHLLNANPNGGANNPSNLSGTFTSPLNRPAPPSGPKALRGLNSRSPFEGSRFKSGVLGSGLNGNGTSGLPGVNGNGMGVGPKRDSNPNNGHPAIPKGPLADRERERDRTNGNWSTKNWGSGWR